MISPWKSNKLSSVELALPLSPWVPNLLVFVIYRVASYIYHPQSSCFWSKSLQWDWQEGQRCKPHFFLFFLFLLYTKSHVYLFGGFFHFCWWVLIDLLYKNYQTDHKFTLNTSSPTSAVSCFLFPFFFYLYSFLSFILPSFFCLILLLLIVFFLIFHNPFVYNAHIVLMFPHCVRVEDIIMGEKWVFFNFLNVGFLFCIIYAPGN
jgi:hypothetical protein